MQTARQTTRHEEIHTRGGVPGGIHEGGIFTLDQLHDLKTKGVPAIMAIPKEEVALGKEEPCFELIKELFFTVPKEHRPQKDKIFKDANSQMGAKYAPTDRLRAGREVKLSLHHLCNEPTLQDCIEFIEKEGGLFTGPEGLLLSWFHCGEELPAEQWLLSIDMEGKLPKDAHGNPRILSIFKSSMPMMGEPPHLIRVDGPLSNKNCLMVLTYEEA